MKKRVEWIVKESSEKASPMPVYREVRCKSILSRSKIADVDYSINPYTGCEHGCAYCYARFMGPRTGHREEWGGFVDIKINAPQTLSKDLTRSRKGLVLLSSVTDPYQPLEERYELTRQILKRLLEQRYPVSILTKSALVERDLDLLRRFEDCQVGFTVTALDERVRKAFEPHSSPPKDRFNALRKLSRNGVQTYVFIAPALPGFTEGDLEEILDRCKQNGVNHVLIDKLNIKYGNWSSITTVLDQQFPERREEWNETLFTRKGYFRRLKYKAVKLAAEKSIPLYPCY